MTSAEAKTYGLKAFNPKNKFTTPGATSSISEITTELEMTKDQVKNIFLEQNLERGLKFPRSLNDCWAELSKIIDFEN